jgi:hypothetical protein
MNRGTINSSDVLEYLKLYAGLPPAWHV